jgi:hypothetical protein
VLFLEKDCDSVVSRQGKETFAFSKTPRPALGSTEPPVEWLPGIKRPGCEVDRLHRPGVNVKDRVELSLYYPCMP